HTHTHTQLQIEFSFSSVYYYENGNGMYSEGSDQPPMVVGPVPGEMFYLTLEASVTVNCHKQNKYYEAKVWVQPCAHVKKLEEFKPLLGAC
ncbi:hypothetical protein Pfo_031155, partial [Paulownia fortunei]